jgi:hypothetical protein
LYARVATFEGGDTPRLRQMNEERQLTPPSGMKRVLLLSDDSSNKRQFIAFFDSKEEIEAASEQFERMGDEIPEDVRGRRLGVDVYEVLADESV